MTISIPDFTKARIAVVGDVMLDRYFQGDSSRISPEAPVPVVHVKKTTHRAGGAGNVALNISNVGGKVKLFSLIGSDDYAAILSTILTDNNVQCCFQSVPNVPTINKLRVISRNQQLIRLDFEESFYDADTDELLENYKNQLQHTNLVIISDYGKGINRNSLAFIAAAKAKNIPILVDPKSKDFSIYRGATVITPNLGEFEAVVGQCANEKVIGTKALELIDAYDFEAVLITRGAQGMTLVQKGKEPLHVSVSSREVYDVTGAGDTVIAIFGAMLASGADMTSSVKVANIAAGLVIQKLGTSQVTDAELRRAIKHQQDGLLGVASEERLLQEIADARAHGETIVITNGCFDILHSGHVYYLEKAKSLGDRLIVAVNSDDSVKRLKGDARPINSLAARMEVLAGLRSVDWVVAFDEDTPERLINAVHPDVLVKGGDYKVDEIAGAKFVMDHGGKVEIIPFLEGFSSSNVIGKLKVE
jgi:D-beta-D-heptose 7-phosphate kinase / D-beta-D-heptose 1-phosphate adenosyltransferase